MGDTVAEWSTCPLDEFDDGGESLHELLGLDVSFALVMCASLRIVVSVMGDTVAEWSTCPLDEFDDGGESLHELLGLAGALELDLDHVAGGGDDRAGTERLVAHAVAGDERR